MAGAYDNQMEHTDGRFHLQLAGTRVAATLTSARSPVQYWAREVPQPLFTVPVPFRPPYPVVRTAEGRPVRTDGTPDPDQPVPRRFLLRVDPDGTVRYVDDTHVEGVGYLAYTLDTVWGTTPAANDHAVLEILDTHWFGQTILSAVPPPVQHEVPATGGPPVSIPAHTAGPFVTINGEGRVTELGTSTFRRHRPHLPAELGELHRLEELDLDEFPARGDIEWGLFPYWAIEPSYGSPVEMMEAQYLTVQEMIEQYGPSRALVGGVPPQLGQLARLRRLDLSGNLLTEPLPPELEQLTSLEILDLSGNLLTGSLPSELGQLTSLETLDLSLNLLTGPLPHDWSQLTGLETLDLSGNRLTGPLPHDWSQLASLQTLYLDSNRLTGPLPHDWSQLASLEWLSLSGNRLTGPLPHDWSQLASLQTLHLSSNRLTGPLPHDWSQLAGLQVLNLRGNQLTGPLPPDWSQLTSLQELDLRGNQLTGPLPLDWSQLAGLHVNLRGNRLTGCYPKPAFQHLYIHDANLPHCSD